MCDDNINTVIERFMLKGLILFGDVRRKFKLSALKRHAEFVV